MEDINKMIDLNIKGLLNCTSVVLPGMKERKFGTVINVSSVAGTKSVPMLSVYSGTKFFVRGVTESMREELAPYNVRFCNLSPGPFNTELASHTMKNENVLAAF